MKPTNNFTPEHEVNGALKPIKVLFFSLLQLACENILIKFASQAIFQMVLTQGLHTWVRHA